MEANASEARSDESRAATTIEDDGAIPQDERVGTMIFAGVLMLFGLFWIWASSDLPSRQQTAYLSQGFMPITAGILLACLSALLLYTTWRTRGVPPAALGREPLFERRTETLAVAIFAALLGYIILLPVVHFALTTFLLIVAGLVIAREPIRPRLFLLAAFMTAAFYAIFIWGLDLPLPGSRYG
jgi:putative tricarboxylic transport membrane protein